MLEVGTEVLGCSEEQSQHLPVSLAEMIPLGAVLTSQHRHSADQPQTTSTCHVAWRMLDPHTLLGKCSHLAFT